MELRDKLREKLIEIFILNDDKYLEYTDSGVWIKDEAISEVLTIFEEALPEEISVPIIRPTSTKKTFLNAGYNDAIQEVKDIITKTKGE